MPDTTPTCQVLSTSVIDFEALFNCSPNPYMLLDRSLRYVAVNDAYLAVTSSQRDALMGRYIFDVFPGDPNTPADENVQRLRASFERVLQHGVRDELALIPYTIPRDTPEGILHEERFWSATHTPLFGPDGAVVFVLQHTVDVTELQQMKNALREAKAAHEQMEEGVLRRARAVQETNRILDAERQRLHTLFRQAPGFMAVLSGSDHVFELTNDAYNQLVGNRKVLGKRVGEALPEVVEQGFVTLLDEVYTTGKPYIGQGIGVLLQREADGPLEQLYVDFLYQPVVELDGRVSGIFVQGHDVTEQVAAQAELQRINGTLEQRVRQRTAELEIRNRELQEFAYVASHDLQEPLRKIQAFAGLLVDEKAHQLDEEGQHFALRMQAAAARMSSLIRDLLAFSRVTTKMQPFVPVDLEALVRDAVDDLDLRLRETQGRVIADALGTLHADPLQMRQLFQNLIANALKFHRPGVPPSIHITREDTEAGVRLVVTDNGIGFEDRYSERIFSPFQRLHTQREYEGTGMGLAIARRIVERHGGTIEAQSIPGEGSRFMIVLPQHPLDA